ncbi:VanZ family protein [Paenibacillus sp. MMS20-IR301]|uniref:VanZ family protein n=1 Tax=Paenibacillus sp. MMS20-IR301 TaxID=2895946 RepID=UPI0028E2A854|nr:VanZ family protein [Paenibacillus sp. MMS20-IR301]WNS45881.1 VanZ family protein [Paenibacillus sp. MMS20-IR301]
MNPAHKLRIYSLQAIFAVYIYILFKIILFKFGSINFGFLWQQLQHSSENIAASAQRGNFIPLVTLLNTFDHPTTHTLVNFTGNIALFIPFGMFLVILYPQGTGGGSFSGVLIRSLGLSAMLECAQAVLYIGTFDVDDLILNTFGGLLGYMLLRPFVRAYSSRKGSSVTKK